MFLMLNLSWTLRNIFEMYLDTEKIFENEAIKKIITRKGETRNVFKCANLIIYKTQGYNVVVNRGNQRVTDENVQEQ